MKKNIIKSLLSLILSFSLLVTGLGLTVHADGGDPTDWSNEYLLSSFSLIINLKVGEPISVNNNDPVNVDVSNIKDVRMKYGLTIPDSIPIKANDTYTFPLPDFFDGDTLNPQPIIDEDNHAIIYGTYEIIDGILIITFDEAIEDYDGKEIFIEFMGDFDTEIFETSELVEVKVPFSDDLSFTGTIVPNKINREWEDTKTGIPFTYKDTDGNPIPTDIDPEYIYWTVTVNDEMKPLDNVVFYDKFSSDDLNLSDILNLDQIEVEIYKLTRNYKNETIEWEKDETAPAPTISGDGFTIELGNIKDAYEIRYITKVNRPAGGGSFTISNSAGLRYSDEDHDIEEPAEVELNWTVDMPAIKKSGKATDNPQIFDWEILYNFNQNDNEIVVLTDFLKYKADSSTDAPVELKVLDVTDIKVYKATNIQFDDDGKIVYDKTLLVGYSGYTENKVEHHLITDFSFELDTTGGQAYYITFSTEVPVGLNGTVTNFIEDDLESKNGDDASIKVDTIPKGGKIGEQLVDDEGNPYIEWTITLNTNRVKAGRVSLFDSFDESLLSLVLNEDSKPVLYKLIPTGDIGDDGKEIENKEKVDSSRYEVVYPHEITDPEGSQNPNDTRKGFLLTIDNIGSDKYEFVYRTYYTEDGMKRPNIANNVDISFVYEEGTGTGGDTGTGGGETLEPIEISVNGPKPGVDKTGKYTINDDKDEQTINWEFVINESRIKLEENSTITDVFGGNYELIGGLSEIEVKAFVKGENDEDVQISFEVGVDYKISLTHDASDPTKITGFEIQLLKDTTAKIVVSYETKVDPDNDAHTNTVTLEWQGAPEEDSAIVKARHTDLDKEFEIIIDETGNKTIEWSIKFNTPENVIDTDHPAPPHVLHNVVISDTLPETLSSGFVIRDIKLYRDNDINNPLVENVDYTFTKLTDKSFEIKIAKIDAVPYEISYKTDLSLVDEDISILNNAGISYIGLTTPNTDSKEVAASTLVLNKSFVKKLKEENNNPIVYWKIEANAAPDNYLKTLYGAVLTDTIPSDQKLIPETIEVKKVLPSGNEDDITQSLKSSNAINVNNNLDRFTINLDNGAFKYIVTFQTEIQHYPSVTSELDETDYEDLFDDLAKYGKQEKHYLDIYTNRAVLIDDPNGTKEEAIADAWFEYFVDDKSGLINKEGAQNNETENIDWIVVVNEEGLIIYDPVIKDTISKNQTYIADTIMVWTQYDEIDETNRELLDDSKYDITVPFKNDDDTWSFKIEFPVEDDETYKLDQQLIITYSTRLDPNEYGSAIEVSNGIVLTGQYSDFDYANSSEEAIAQQWFYGGGGSGKLLNFVGIKRSKEETPLTGVTFTLQRFNKVTNGFVPVGDQMDLTTEEVLSLTNGELEGAFDSGSIRAGFYKLTEVEAPTGYVANPPIYFVISYADKEVSHYDYLITIYGENWSDLDGSNVPNVSVDQGNQMTITNNYAPIAVVIEASKLLEDRELIESELFFDFELYQVVDEVEKTITQVKNNENGQVVFSGNDPHNISELQFDSVGIYTFYIREVDNDHRFVQDDTLYMVEVDVKEAEKGLYATVTYYLVSDIAGDTLLVKLGEDELPVFNNYYSARIVLEAEKILSGRRLREGEFKFELSRWLEEEDPELVKLDEATNDSDGLITFSEIVFDDEGDYYYVIKELPGSAGGVVYDDSIIVVTVNVAYNEDSGKLEAWIQGYYRTVLGEDGLPDLVLGDGDIPYPDEGELPTFINRYTAAPNVAIIEARKVLVGKDLTAGMFSFELLDSNGKVIETVKNKADGHINFAEITYYSAGDYNYTIREVKGAAEDGITYDETVHEVTVRVTDGGNGQLYTDVIYKENKIATFTNTYKAATTRANLTAHKTLTGKVLTANQFSFELVDKDGKVIETVKNKADGSISFAALNFDAAGEYSYTIREVKGSEAGITYDKTVHQVTVKVTDDKEGKLHAEVVYANGKAPTFTNSFSDEDTGSQFPTEPGEESKPGIPQTGEGRSTSALGLALIVAGLAFGLFAWRQRPRKRFSGQE